MAYDPLTPQELLVLRALKRANGWTPHSDVVRRYRRDAGVKGGRAAGVLSLLNSILPSLVDKAYARRELRGQIEGFVITPRGQAVLAAL